MTISAQSTNSYAFDEENEDWIQFKTTPDALIAKLHLQDRIPPRYIDMFLKLVCNEHFDTSKVSFRKTTDIDKSVASYRHARARQRSVFCYSSPSTRLPYDIFPLIIEHITRERLPLRTDDPLSCFGVLAPDENHPDRIASRLQALALTHRALTPLAQRALGQRILVHKGEHLRAVTRSPLLGPWTTELTMNLCFSSSEYDVSEESIDCALTTLREAPGLRFLRIRMPSHLNAENTPYLQQLLAEVGKLAQLETLWWIAPECAARYAKTDIEDVCRLVGGMPCLRNLVLRNARCGWAAFNEEAGVLTHNLRSLALGDFICPSGEDEPKCISWLLNSKFAYYPALTSLSLDLTANPDMLITALTSSSVFPYLHTLRIRFALPQPPSFFASLFSQINSSALPLRLHTLQLSLERPPPRYSAPIFNEKMFAHIPSSVRVLQLALFQLSDSTEWSVQELELAGALKDRARRHLLLPKLQALEITEPPQRYPLGWGLLRAACKKRGCTFTVRRVIKSGFA
ncbi:hypothetical protein EW145_g7427 [Phellinidium pouzarii]|uniref:Uncharacterized protein n=1 Tax=Phellinidium pouzarii TaxID=167371 RepID=A0A4S4KKE3_9AGAM|nr:hypothetical protein EW145_g7427 [Phellinidium pouzarii]